MTTRDEAIERHELRAVSVLGLVADRCTNVYGQAPCTAAGGPGGECRQTYPSCQDKPNYAAGTRTTWLGPVGMAAPVGETIRPYLQKLDPVATEIQPGKGLPVRARVLAVLTDEPCDDLDDPYRANRLQPAGGTFLSRYLVRNRYLVGRPAILRRGFVVSPWSWDTFRDEQYVITQVSGRDAQGLVKVTLQDPIRLLDSAMLPPATDGALTAALKATAFVGVVVSATANTVTLPSTGEGAASAIDGAYVGMEFLPYAGTAAGEGNRRTITAYVGATRTATVDTAFAVIPDSTTSCEIGGLSLTLSTGAGTQYPDPAVSGQPEYVRIGREVIRYTAKSGDVLSWPDTTYRAQFGSNREDHAANDQVQVGWALIDQPADVVVRKLLNAGAIADANIDLALLAAEVAEWIPDLRITDCLTAPERVSALLADFLVDIEAAVWWSALDQKVKFRLDMPEFGGAATTLTDADVVEGSVLVEPQDNDWITRQALYHGLRDATEDRRKVTNFLRSRMVINDTAEGPNERNAERAAIRYSHWLDATPTSANHAAAWCMRRVRRLHDTPAKVSFQVMQRSALAEGELVNLVLRALPGFDGEPETTLVRVVKVEDQGAHLDIVAVTTGFGGRHAFVAPDAALDYAAASDADKLYAYIADDDGFMPDGSDAYLII